jgi:RHS repeat-associated protein
LHVAQVGGGTTTFAYDADGGRVKTVKASGATVYTPFPDYEEELNGPAVIRRSTYRLAGQLVAVRVSGDPVTANNGLFYYHTDHLGSTAALTKGSDGAVLGSSVARYYPFGAYRTAPTATVTDREYTGHRHNDDIGLIYMNARYYVSSIGRFASADSLVPDPAAPQSHNRYSYSLNNPTNYSDPTGHYVADNVGGRVCEEWHGCPQHQLFAKDFNPTAPDDPRTHELISIGCAGDQCRVLPSLIPAYLAGEHAAPGAERSEDWRTIGQSFDAVAAGIDIAATGVSASFVGGQVLAALLGGPGLDDAVVAGAYYLADSYIENPASWLAFGFIAAGDYASGESYLGSGRIVVGQDTIAVFGTAALGDIAGRMPVAGPALDTIINLAVNAYDVGRLSGRIPTFAELRVDTTGPYLIFYQ